MCDRCVSSSQHQLPVVTSQNDKQIVNKQSAVELSTNKSEHGSNISLRTSLALQRLEEDRKLRGQREREALERQRTLDEEYLAKKYSILENDGMSNFSFDDEEISFRMQYEQVRNWTEKVRNNDNPEVTE